MMDNKNGSKICEHLENLLPTHAEYIHPLSHSAKPHSSTNDESIIIIIHKDYWIKMETKGRLQLNCWRDYRCWIMVKIIWSLNNKIRLRSDEGSLDWRRSLLLVDKCRRDQIPAHEDCKSTCLTKRIIVLAPHRHVKSIQQPTPLHNTKH